ncbi:NAD(P)H dehydrogenase [quinone] 1-like [Embiotoca jacksoni]|uniref:NAD(P)H dehydrogenase [quinone] 1-like n=1 Tax=Embiotoca jacksoni TaxID=100190 RepID=UPI003704B362
MAQGCTVKVSDLYAMKFKAAATAKDLTGRVTKPKDFCYPEETRLALEEGKLSDEITEEQSKLIEADLIIFQFPMYWFTVPAIMKVWFDRVLTPGFANTPEKRFTQGVFKDKKAMLSFTTRSKFNANQINENMNVTLWPVQNGILNHCGFQVLAPQIFWAPSCDASVARDSMLEGWRKRLQDLLGEEPVSFISADCFVKETVSC